LYICTLTILEMLEPLRYILEKSTIVLASASPRRREILDNQGLTFVVRPSNVEENLDKNNYKGKPFDYTVDTAALKADDVYAKTSSEFPHGSLLVIGCDTVVTCQGQIYEKPKDRDDAVRMLSTLSGNKHVVYSGVKMIWRVSDNASREVSTFYEGTEVEMADLTDKIIKGYVETGEPMDKAGGYGIQSRGGSLVSGISGDYFNVMGFPVHRFSVELTKLLNGHKL